MNICSTTVDYPPCGRIRSRESTWQRVQLSRTEGLKCRFGIVFFACVAVCDGTFTWTEFQQPAVMVHHSRGGTIQPFGYDDPAIIFGGVYSASSSATFIARSLVPSSDDATNEIASADNPLELCTGSSAP